MKKAIFLLVMLIFVISCQQTRQSGQTEEDYKAEVKEKIAQLGKLYFEAWENKDVDSTLFFLDEGFINMFSFNLFQTKEECRKDWENVFNTYAVEGVEYKSVEIIVDQNFAFETGLFKQKWITSDKQDTLFFDMRGMSVFKKQEDGSWKFFRLFGQQ
jgi:ketosteroid isomerase-like protein